MATKKETLQAEATSLGIAFTQRTTIAALEALIAEALAEVDPSTTTEAVNDLSPAHPGPNVRFDQGRCPICGTVNDHTHSGDRGV